MSPRFLRIKRGRAAPFAAGLAAVMLVVFSAGRAFGAQGDVGGENAKLGIRPVGQQGNFFELSAQPGESRKLTVELKNYGDRPIAARTFPADAYTIVNGGFGARLRSEPKTGTTLWMDYKEEVLQLAPQQGVTRTFTVSVPPGTSSGDYITSLVIENEEPITGGTGSIAINQIQRQALAVSISIPGPRTPRLEFRNAKHNFVGERSVVAVALQNSGNARLRPSGRLVVQDGSRKTIFDSRVAMDSFYARTSTSLEAPLGEPLSPGRYLAILRVEDKENGLEVRSRPLNFTVSGAPQEPAERQAASGSTGNMTPWLIAGGVLVVLALSAGIFLGRRQRSTSAAP